VDDGAAGGPGLLDTHRMALEVVDVLQRVDGSARAADLIALCGRAALVRAVGSGTVVRVARGRYALAICPDPGSARCAWPASSRTARPLSTGA
jgi:hypothetical protein